MLVTWNEVRRRPLVRRDVNTPIRVSVALIDARWFRLCLHVSPTAETLDEGEPLRHDDPPYIY